jgi:hypothetical protein
VPARLDSIPAVAAFTMAHQLGASGVDFPVRVEMVAAAVFAAVEGRLKGGILNHSEMGQAAQLLQHWTSLEPSSTIDFVEGSWLCPQTDYLCCMGCCRACKILVAIILNTTSCSRSLGYVASRLSTNSLQLARHKAQAHENLNATSTCCSYSRMPKHAHPF